MVYRINMPRFTLIPPRLNISKNVQVTRSLYVDHARSESVVSVNPGNNDNLIAASKRFRNLHTYDFTIEAEVSFDGGKTWNPYPLLLPPEWNGGGLSDPTLAWDDRGWAYLFVGPTLRGPNPSDAVGTGGNFLGLWVYISKDGGKSWGTPVAISKNGDDDKQWAASDITHDSPHYGNVYVAWGAATPLRFGRSRNPGTAWSGPGNVDPASSSLVDKAYSPEVSVGPDGTIYILSHNPGSDSIQFVKSTDGGQSFTNPTNVVIGLTSISRGAPSKNSWPHFPDATFRVHTLVTDCVVDQKTLIVAWADYRHGVSRIYYRRSTDGGDNWEGPVSGQPLLAPGIASPVDAHDFHPQIIALPNGTVGCAFYEFGPTLRGHEGNLIDVVLVASLDHGETFSLRDTVTEAPWDPAVNAPWAHGDPEVTFIGEYFGLDVDQDYFYLVWTDTRTGMQELFAAKAYVQTSITEFDPMEDGEIVFVPSHGSAGGTLFNHRTGKIVGPIPNPYPEWNLQPGFERQPTWRDERVRQINVALDAFAVIENIPDASADSVKIALLDSIRSIATQGSRDLQGISKNKPLLGIKKTSKQRKKKSR